MQFYLKVMDLTIIKNFKFLNTKYFLIVRSYPVKFKIINIELIEI